MKLDPAEKAIVDSFDKGEWRSVSNLKTERKRLISDAAATFRKDRPIDIYIFNKPSSKA